MSGRGDGSPEHHLNKVPVELPMRIGDISSYMVEVIKCAKLSTSQHACAFCKNLKHLIRYKPPAACCVVASFCTSLIRNGQGSLQLQALCGFNDNGVESLKYDSVGLLSSTAEHLKSTNIAPVSTLGHLDPNPVNMSGFYRQ